jgi:hypothetical protein
LPGTRGISHFAFVALLCVAPLFSQTVLDDLRARYTHEPDPVRKAKLLPKLGDAEFLAVQKQLDAGSTDDALAAVREYRDQAQSCVTALDAKEPDPEKHSSGYKQLQISLRESIRRIDFIMANLTGDDQKPFRALRDDLEQLDQHVIKELFPRQPASDKSPGKPKS